MKVLAVKLPCPCIGMGCGECRNPIHGGGNASAVIETVKNNLDECIEVHVTGNGELCDDEEGNYQALERVVKGAGIPMSILCAKPESIVPGLVRAEISWHKGKRELAVRAIARARDLGVRPVLTVVDRHTLPPIEKLAEDFEVDGVLIRAGQAEGRAKKSWGTTRVFTRPGVDLGKFPLGAYPEVAGHGFKVVCVGIYGKVIPSLGGPYVDM